MYREIKLKIDGAEYNAIIHALTKIKEKEESKQIKLSYINLIAKIKNSYYFDVVKE